MNQQILQALMMGAGGGQVAPAGAESAAIAQAGTGNQAAMGSPMGVAGTDLDPRMSQMKRQQRMADMLRQSALTPRGPIQSRVGPVSQGIGGPIQQMAEMMMAEKMQGRADEQMGQIGRDQTANRANYMDQLIMALRHKIPGSNTAQLPPEGMEDR